MRLGTNDELFFQVKEGSSVKLVGRTDETKELLTELGNPWWLVRAIKGKNLLCLVPGKRVWVNGPNCPEFILSALMDSKGIIRGRS